jgi:nickel/cobalt exporter
MSEAGIALVFTTIATAVVHTLIPDHWLPFVLVSRSQGWTVRQTLFLTTVSALLHVSVSIALGVVVAVAGQGAEEIVGIAEGLEWLGGAMLVLFGIVYMVWFLLRGGHVHSFGLHPHHGSLEVEHHGSGRSPRARRLTGFTLALIVGFNPCILVIPIIYGAVQLSELTLTAVILAFSATTVLTMVGSTLLGLRGASRLTSTFLTRYGEALSGGLIALTGVAVMLFEIEML